MHNIKVSVLMTSFNREKYIAQAIESVLASSYKNFELIIVDDCSDDNTLEIARSYELKDSRVQVYKNDVNLGDYPNRNNAASYAKGQYIKYVDADDLIYPWGLEIIINNLEKFPEVGYCLDSIEQDYHKIFPFVLSPEEAYEREYFNSSIFNKAPTSSTIKLDLFKKVGGFSGKQHVGDFELWHKLSLTEKVLLLPHGIVWSREHEEQESKANRSDTFILFKYFLISLHFLNLKEAPLILKNKYAALKKVKKSMARSILRSVILEVDFPKALKKKNLSGLSFIKVLYYGIKK